MSGFWEHLVTHSLSYAIQSSFPRVARQITHSLILVEFNASPWAQTQTQTDNPRNTYS